ncbi:unnamed protein product [Protopolystoma xenopodis]|uniref:Uncharacterized protein n=1 Tax=Protopolystoma xenopodis TaxID=117903 RepID=A0A3S5C287_9PLAT|nr:unnamed protein product [Protopolystoma xenopodis]
MVIEWTEVPLDVNCVQAGFATVRGGEASNHVAALGIHQTDYFLNSCQNREEHSASIAGKAPNTVPLHPAADMTRRNYDTVQITCSFGHELFRIDLEALLYMANSYSGRRDPLRGLS